MCFEWDKRYFRELEEKKSKEKLDQLLKNAEDAVTLEQSGNAVEGHVDQPGGHKETALS